MGLPAEKHKMTSDEFLSWELEQIEKHDFVDGEVYAMSGAEANHVVSSMNVGFALRNHLKGTRCRAFIIDMKLKVEATGNFFYPDVFVTCSERDRKERLVQRDAKLIIEILSKSTAAYDRGDKFANYRQIPTLEEYAMIDLDRRTADLYRIGADGLWVLHPLELKSPGDAITFKSVDATINVETLFADVD